MDRLIYSPPWLLKNGLSHTIYSAWRASRNWEKTILEPEPIYQERVFVGAQGVPIFGIVAIPPNPHGTIVGTYGITGTLDNQWYLKLLGRKAYSQGYSVVFFDWRAHGKTAELSPTLTSDGLYEGEDFVRIAATAKTIGCPAPFWFTGYSLGGQLALWAVKAGQTIEEWGRDLNLDESEIGGGAVICPSLDSKRSLTYLESDRLGRYLEKAIAKELKTLARQINQYHPKDFDPAAIERANSIREFDRELVIEKLGFASVEEYYDASSPLYLLPNLKKPTLILYAADDPMFDPTVVADLPRVCQTNSAIELMLTEYGGHVGYLASKTCQNQWGDRDRWWAWNRILDWCNNY
jgi:hypothetical protein